MNGITNTKKRHWLLMAGVLTLLLANIDYTAVNLSLVKISSALHADLNTVQWVLGAYVLAWAAIMVPASRLIVKYGHFRTILFGLLLFLVGSVVAGASFSVWMIIFGRVLQGIAAAFFLPAIYALVVTLSPEGKQGQDVGILGLGAGLGLALGPTFGGIILTLLGWRWIFFINIPIILFVLAIVWVAASRVSVDRSVKLDKFASMLLMLGVISFLYMLSLLHQPGMNLPVFLLLSIAVIAFGLLSFQQRRAEQFLAPWSILKNRHYLGAVLSMVFLQYAFAVSIVAFGLYLQKVMGFSVFKASIYFLAYTLVFGLFSPFIGRLVDLVGIRKPSLLGIALLFFGLLIMGLFPGEMNPSVVLLALFLTGLGVGLAYNPLVIGSLIAIGKQNIAAASSIRSTACLTANAIGVLLVAIIYEAVGYQFLARHVEAQLKHHLTSIQAHQLHQSIVYIGSSTHELGAFNVKTQQAITHYMPQALSHGLSVAFLFGAGACVFSFFIVRVFYKG